MEEPKAPTSGLPEVLVTGATGFIGRWVVLELTRSGRPVAVLLRGGPAQMDTLSRWLEAHGGNPRLATMVTGDLTRDQIGLDDRDDELLADVRYVYSLAGRFEFGLGVDDARRTNVDGPLRLARWAMTRPSLHRFVHVSGYRVNDRLAGRDLPLTDDAQAVLYRELGAYEASKLEGDAMLRADAASTGLPLTIINPSTVVGDSVTGETTQFIGLAASLHDLWRGRLPLVPGTDRTFVPIVAADHLARVMVAAATRDDPPGTAYWVMHDDTPPLVELVNEAARHLGVRSPRGTIPTGLVRRLPSRLTGADPETLSFLSEERYPTDSYHELVRDSGLAEPSAIDVLHRWLDYLVDVDFAPTNEPTGGRFVDVAGSRTFVTGPAGADVVLVHGLPHDSRVWNRMCAQLAEPALRLDVPGVSRSSATTAPTPDWMVAALAGARAATPTVLVGHSLGAAHAVEFAAAAPDKVGALVLVSPFFLQRRAPLHLRLPASLIAPAMHRTTAARLGGAHFDDATAQTYASAVGNLRRPGVARRIASTLRAVSTTPTRQRLAHLLEGLEIPVTIVIGEHDPLIEATRHGAVVVIGGDHDLPVTHPGQVAEIVARTRAQLNPAGPTPATAAGTAART